THRGDPIALLDLDAALISLRARVQQPDFIQQLVRELLLDNPHRVRLTLRPDTQINARKQAAEVRRLAELKAQLTDADKQAIVARTQALQARQLQKDDESILPKVTLADVPGALHYTSGSHESVNDFPLRRYRAGTNGLVYQQITCKLPNLSDDLVPLLPYFTSCLTELGIGTRDYLDTQRWQAEVVGSIGAYTNVRGSSANVQAIDAYITLSAKALSRNRSAMNELMQQTLQQARFDELPRIRELIAQARARREQSITGNGHSLAMSAACAGMSPSAKLSHELSGLVGIAALK